MSIIVISFHDGHSRAVWMKTKVSWANPISISDVVVSYRKVDFESRSTGKANTTNLFRRDSFHPNLKMSESTQVFRTWHHAINASATGLAFEVDAPKACS
jgi:hypothetical protein